MVRYKLVFDWFFAGFLGGVIFEEEDRVFDIDDTIMIEIGDGRGGFVEICFECLGKNIVI